MYSCVTGRRRLPAAVFVLPSMVCSFVFLRDLLIAIIFLSNSISDQRSAASSPRLVPHAHAVFARYLNCIDGICSKISLNSTTSITFVSRVSTCGLSIESQG